MSAPAKKAKLYKREKLCSKQAIDSLFARNLATASDSSTTVHTKLAFPLRAVWRVISPSEAAAAGVAPVPQFLISVPKKRLRHAVDRVRIRRLVREAWRLNREQLTPTGSIQIVMIYVAPKLVNYHKTARAVVKIMQAVNASYLGTDNDTDPNANA